MTTLESLIAVISKVSRPERKLIRNYLSARRQSSQPPNKMLKLFDLLITDHKRKWTAAELEKKLDLQRHHATFGRLVSHLRKRIIEALSLPVVTACDETYSMRTKALFHYHRHYLKAMILFEAGDYALADETLLSLLFLTEKHELHAERIAVAEFLMRTIRIYSVPESLKYFKDVPENSRRVLALNSCAERIREMIEEGKYNEAHEKFSELNECIKNSASRYAIFVMKGVEAKTAALGGKYKRAEKLLFEQLACCNHEAVWSEENRAQVYADIAQNSISLKKNALALEYIEMALRCRRKFKTTTVQIEQIQMLLEKQNRSAETKKA